MSKMEKYESVYRQYANDVYRVALYLVKDEEKAKTITRQAFVNIYKKLDEIDDSRILSQLLIETKMLTEKKRREKSDG